MFLLINKPIGPTSHDVINRLRRLTGQKTIGHAGTLDPFASGLLLVAIGRESTKELHKLQKLDKTYEATLRLGAVSDTYDKTGHIKKYPISNIQLPLTTKKIQATLKKFIGEQFQTPPSFSAKKINGQKAYNLARQGKAVSLSSQKINIYKIKILKIENCPPRFALRGRGKLKIKIFCSSGTYIRSLAEDFGQALGLGAYLIKLIRTAIGPFKLKNAVPLHKLTAANWQKYVLINLPSLPAPKKILVFGTFDLLHQGHLFFLRQAKDSGDQLYVIVARDHNVKLQKGCLPIDNELTRLKNIKAQNIANEVMLGALDFTRRYKILNKIKPDLIALGYDQKVNLPELKRQLQKYHLNPEIISLPAFQPEKYKTSLLKNNKQ